MNYKKYTKPTRKYMEAVEAYLVAQYGSVNPEWESSLLLLADNLDLYEECKESIKVNGIFNPDRFTKNPLLSTMKDLQATMLKIFQHLGISPYAVSKIHITPEDDTDDFLDNLTS